MKKIFLYLSLCMSVAMVSCSDDETYFVNENPILNEQSVVTGSADVTSTTATLYATVSGLEHSAASSYAVGFNYGTDQNNLKDEVRGSLVDGKVVATISGLTDNTTIYYQAFATLQGRVTYRGEVKSLVTTDAKIKTDDAKDIDYAGAILAGTVESAPEDAPSGIVISTWADTEAVRAGLIIASGSEGNGTFSIDMHKLAPATTYYYATYSDLGSGVIYGDVKSFTTPAYSVDLDNDMVDLGLSVKWAKYNVGARSQSDLGAQFGYGELTGVCNTIDVSDYASGDIYRTGQDMANVLWNGSVTLPTAADFEELFASCTKEWSEVDGVAGYTFTGPNGNSIFLPAAGSRTINTVNGQGQYGAYATGSINPGNNQYAVSYHFDNAQAYRNSTPVYEALSVRPVSTGRNVKLDMAKLYGTWEIDYLSEDGTSQYFNGPVWFYGTADSWRTVSNQEPIVGDSWCWDADASNSWAFGNCEGYMTLNEDGTVIVKCQDGEEMTGKYTVDQVNKTISADIDLLTPSAFNGQVSNKKTEIKILSLVDGMLQLGFLRDSDPATLSVNMIPKNKKYGMPVSLLAVGSDWGGTWGSEVAKLTSTELDGVHTFTYEGSCNGAMVLTLDFVGLRATYPNAIVSIRDIRLDGQSIKFDSNKMFYGDIENNGNYRIEMFNIWGKGSVDGKVDSPFSNLVADADPAFTFVTKLEMDYVILTEPTFRPTLITINPSWGGPWDYNSGQQFSIVVDDANKLAIDGAEIDVTYESTDHADGSIMTFVQIDGMHDYFPGLHSTLDAIYLDGNELTGWDPAKVIDAVDGSAYRLELWNCYGATGGQGCAFGERDGDVIHELGFSQSMRLRYTLRSLFPAVEF